MPTAILVDGGFFLSRYRQLCGQQTPAEVAKSLHRMCLSHLQEGSRRADEPPRPRRQLYRIFYYDCPPLKKKSHNPISGKSLDFSKTDVARWRNDFFNELKKLRKVALRLGQLNEDSASWNLRPKKLKELFSGKCQWSSVSESDVFYEASQKGVDMRIGLDIASMSLKGQVDQIILVSGDSDFVPAAKLARREGVDFILDPMWSTIRADLFEHIDGLQTKIKRVASNDSSAAPPSLE